MLDRYLFGNVERISPEAPVPVVEVKREQAVLGGAANVAANMASLGAKVTLVAAVGKDAAARDLTRRLEQAGIDAGALVTDSARPTTVKTRVIGGSQQIVRVDREVRGPLPARVASRLARRLPALAAEADAILVSDYGKGVIQPPLLDTVREIRTGSGIPVVVDPKDIHFSNYRRFSLITPNLNETSMAVGFKVRSDEDVVRAGTRLLAELELENLLITRGAQGMSLFSPGSVVHIPTMAREVFDVSGAGDTVAALMTMSLAAGIDRERAAHLANAAAAVVVARVGTAVVDRESLLQSLEWIEK